MKDVIVKNAMGGPKGFQTDKETTPTTDWNKTGVGFTMTQKYCPCEAIKLTCYKEGWKTCMIDNRLTNQVELNYALTKGECLRKTKYYTLGARELTICADHKPSLGIINNTMSKEVENRKLAQLKRKIMGWRFLIYHIPRKKLRGTVDLAQRRRVKMYSILSDIVQDFKGGDIPMVLDDMDALFKNRKYPCRIKRWRTPNDVTIITPYRDPVGLILPMNIQDVMPNRVWHQSTYI